MKELQAPIPYVIMLRAPGHGVYTYVLHIYYISHPDAEVSNETAAIDETAGCYAGKRREMEEADW